MGPQTKPSVEGSFSNPSVRVPFRYVPTIHESRPTKNKNTQRYFSTSSTLASASPSSKSQHTLDNHWKKQHEEFAFEYIARWWYDTYIPFNVCYPRFLGITRRSCLEAHRS
jgi:hypothetical protein